MISIIIPALEEEKYIEKTIRQFDSFAIAHELIVSDGKSPDRTVEIARQCGAKVTVFAGEKPSPSRQRNDGRRIASGDMLVFIDGSVRIPQPNEFFQRALAHFEKNPKLVSLSVPQWIEPEKQTRTDHIMLKITNWVLKFQNNTLGIGVGSGKFMMIPTGAFDAVGGFREDLITREDGDLVYRLSKVGDTLFDPSFAIFYSGRREHAVGWLKLLWIWILNDMWVRIFKKAHTKEWTPVR